ncbi:MAG: hypothetical protein LAT64_01330 [Phycisphaerales bacterium]|nr:hypothetical protein [Planctomycetota bacterium]MCH8507403.1 hypothetical protein [Phycisphaerales bacterium]
MATPTPIPPPNPPFPGRPASLWLVLGLTFLGSIGTGAVTNGIFFITSAAMGYGRRENLWLGAVFGATYIAAALLAGPGLRTLARRVGWISTRGVTTVVLALMGVACLLPLAAREAAPGLIEPAVWAMVLVYSPATGVLWPVVESYLSGGRSGKRLRWAIGRFNIVWSAALVGAYFGMAPLLEHRPFWILAGLGAIHLAMCAVMFALPREPARHAEDHEPHPPVYEALLALFRVLLFSSYLILSAVNPIQPIILERLEVRVAWWMPVASVWLAARVFVFVLFERWHGWHGRWWTPWAGLGAMVLGFAMTVGSPAFGPSAGLGVFAAGLACMGAGIAAIYCGALYYAMAVGSAGVDAGGKHEAVIGMGYTIGPVLGLVALGLAGTGPDGTEPDAEAFRAWTISLVTLAAIGTGLWGWRVARRRQRTFPETPP